MTGVVRLLYGECSEVVGDIEEAKITYEGLIIDEPHNALAHTALGLLLLGTGTRNYGAVDACGTREASDAVEHLKFALLLDSSIKRARDAIQFCELEVTEVTQWRSIASNIQHGRSQRSDQATQSVTPSSSSGVLTNALKTFSLFLESFLDTLRSFFPTFLQEYIDKLLPKKKKKETARAHSDSMDRDEKILRIEEARFICMSTSCLINCRIGSVDRRFLQFLSVNRSVRRRSSCRMSKVISLSFSRACRVTGARPLTATTLSPTISFETYMEMTSCA